MGLIERIAAFTGFERRATHPDALDPSWAAIGSGVGYASAVSARGAENLSGVLACINVIADSLAYVYPSSTGARAGFGSSRRRTR